MDWPLSFAISIPSASFLATCGALIAKKMSRSRSDSVSSPSVSRKTLDGILDKKFEKVRYVGECEAISEGLKREMVLTREVIHDGLEAVREEIKLSRGRV